MQRFVRSGTRFTSMSSRALMLAGTIGAFSLSQGMAYAEESTSALPPPVAPAARKKGKKAKKNPGKYDELNKAIGDVLDIQNFQGAKFSMNNPMFYEPPPGPSPKPSNSKQVILGTNINMGSPHDPSGSSVDFQAMSFFYGGQLGLISMYQLGQGPQPGRMNGRIIAKPRKGSVSGALIFAITDDPNYNQLVLEGDFKGDDYTVGVSLMSQLGAMSYLQRLTPAWSAGIQGINQFGQLSWLNYCLSYSTMKRKTNGEQFIVQVPGRGPITVGYAHKVDEGLTLAAEIACAPNLRESSARAGALYTKKTYMFRANVDNTFKVASTLDMATGLGPRFSVSAELKHATNESNFGFGVSMG